LLSGHRVHPVEAVFAGHEAFYERGDIDGIRYLNLGAGGAPMEDPDPQSPGVQSAAAALSYARVDVCGCHAALRVKDISGKVIDALTLADCPTPCSVPEAALAAAAAPAPPAKESPPGRKRPRRRKGDALDAGKRAAENRGR